VMRMYAFGNVFVGDLELGRQTFMRSLEISPASLMTYEILEGLSLSHLLMGEHEEAAEWAQRSIAVNGQWPAAYWNLASAYGHLGRTAEAADAVNRLLTLAPWHRLSHFERIEPSYDVRHRIVLEGLRKAGLPA
jgi:tetratricopeptide (TPR) repeat protein